MSYKDLVKRLEDEGFETYLVGGALRDKLFGKKIHDIDLTTRARPSEIMRIFSDLKLIDIGKKFGTIKVIYKSKEYEITTFRAESSYKDKRHPDEISFSNTIEEDLKRAGIFSKWWLINSSLYASNTTNKILKSKANEEVKWINYLNDHTKENLAIIGWNPKKLSGDVLEDLIK